MNLTPPTSYQPHHPPHRSPSLPIAPHRSPSLPIVHLLNAELRSRTLDGPLPDPMLLLVGEVDPVKLFLFPLFRFKLFTIPATPPVLGARGLRVMRGPRWLRSGLAEGARAATGVAAAEAYAGET
ncbi:hypothetical protein C8J56DRAFT_1054902 [Mycena floridula]|nr:hypothetical protein C8J56DRAFT_1054902 [Mycena floridula]